MENKIYFRKLIREGILDKKTSEFLSGPVYTSDPDEIKKLISDMFNSGVRTYNMTGQMRMLLLMGILVGVKDVTGITKMADILPVSLLQDTLERRQLMIEKIEKKEENDLIRKIEAAYISDELSGAREIVKENARLKKELEEAKKKLDQFNEDVILKTRDVIARIFSSTDKSILRIAEAEAKKT